MPIIGVIASSILAGATTPIGYIANANPDGVKAMKSFSYTTETYTTLTSPVIEINQAAAYMNNKRLAGYASAFLSSSGNPGFSWGRNTVKFNFVTNVISYITNQITYDVFVPNAASNEGSAGYILGGMNLAATSGVSTCNKMPYSTETPANISATLSPARGGAGSDMQNGNTAGYLMGGTNNNGGTVFTSINKIAFSNDTLTTLSATLVTRASNQSTATTTYGNTSCFVFGGFNNPSDTNAVARLTFSNETADQPVTAPVTSRVSSAFYREPVAAFVNFGNGDIGGNTRKFTYSNNTFTNLGFADGYVYTASWSNQGA